MEIFVLKPLVVEIKSEIKSVFKDVKWSFNASWGLNPYSTGIDFSRQNLTSVDVRFWRLKSLPALYE